MINKRYFFKAVEANEFSIAPCLSEIDLQIFNSAKIELESNETILYFADGVESKSILVGRYVKGFDTDLFIDTSFKDLSFKKIQEHPIKFFESIDGLKSSIADRGYASRPFYISLMESYSLIKVFYEA